MQKQIKIKINSWIHTFLFVKQTMCVHFIYFSFLITWPAIKMQHIKICNQLHLHVIFSTNSSFCIIITLSRIRCNLFYASIDSRPHLFVLQCGANPNNINLYWTFFMHIKSHSQNGEFWCLFLLHWGFVIFSLILRFVIDQIAVDYYLIFQSRMGKYELYQFEDLYIRNH